MSPLAHFGWSTITETCGEGITLKPNDVQAIGSRDRNQKQSVSEVDDDGDDASGERARLQSMSLCSASPPHWEMTTFDDEGEDNEFANEEKSALALSPDFKLRDGQRFTVTCQTPIAETLQGWVFMGQDLCRGKPVVIKTARRALVDKGVCINGRDIEEDILKESKLMQRISRNQGIETNGSDCQASFCHFCGFWKDEECYYLAVEYGGQDYFDFVCAALSHMWNNPISVRVERGHAGASGSASPDLVMGIDEWAEIIRYQFRQLACTVHHFHQTVSIAHLDLSLENTVIDEAGNVTIIDFGVAHNAAAAPAAAAAGPYHGSHEARPWDSVRYVGKIEYMAPEVLNLGLQMQAGVDRQGGYAKHAYDARGADMWCLGIILFRMCYFHTPTMAGKKDETGFRVNSVSASLMDARDDAINQLKKGCYVDAQATLDILKGLLAARPADRMTVGQLIKTDYVVNAPKVLSQSLQSKVKMLYQKLVTKKGHDKETSKDH